MMPYKLSSFILKEIKSVAEKRLNREIKEAVITVPAYFGQATRSYFHRRR